MNIRINPLVVTTGSKTWACIVFAITLIYFLFLFPSPEYCTFNKDDGSLFMILATNLVETGQYSTDIDTGSLKTQVMWPFVFPFILASVIALFGKSWIAIKSAMVLMGLLSLILISKLLGNREWRRVTIVLTALNPVFFLFSHHTMSEIPFLMMSAAALFALSIARTKRGVFAAGVIATIAFYTRGYGIALAPAGALFLLLAKDSGALLRNKLIKTVCYLAPLGVGVCGWAIWQDAMISSGEADAMSEHFAYMSGAGRLTNNSVVKIAQHIYWYHLRSISFLIAPIADWHDFFDSDWSAVLGIFCTAFILVGWFVSVRSAIGVVEAWLPCSIAVSILFECTQPRYWIAHYPFLVFYFLIGFHWFGCRIQRLKYLPPVITALLIGMHICCLAGFLLYPDRLRFPDTNWKGWRDIGLWCRDNTEPNALIACHHTTTMFVTSNRRTFSYTKLTPHFFGLDNPKNIYVILANTSMLSDKRINSQVQVQRMVNSENLPVLHEIGGHKVYKLSSENP